MCRWDGRVSSEGGVGMGVGVVGLWSGGGGGTEVEQGVVKSCGIRVIFFDFFLPSWDREFWSLGYMVVNEIPGDG